MKSKILRLSSATFYLQFKCGQDREAKTAFFKFVDPAYEAYYLTSHGITNPIEVLLYELKHLTDVNIEPHINSIDTLLSPPPPQSVGVSSVSGDLITKINIHWPLCPFIWVGERLCVYCLILNIIQLQYTDPNRTAAPALVLPCPSTDASGRKLPYTFTDLISGNNGVLPNEVPKWITDVEGSTYYWLFGQIWRAFGDTTYTQIPGFGPYTYYNVTGDSMMLGFSCKGRGCAGLCMCR